MENKRIYTVYMHVNKINGKRYIGITMRDVIKRWKINGSGYSYNSHFYSSIKKYGWDNFEHEVVLCNLTKEEAEMFEVEMIRKYKTTDADFGYNKHSGGNTTPALSSETKDKIRKALKGHIKSKETCKKLSESHRGKKLSEETKKKLSEANKGSKNYFYGKSLVGEEHGMFGKNHSDKSRKKISENHAGTRKIVCLETKTTYKSIASAARDMGLNRICIQSCCAGDIQATAGYHFVYFENFINYNIPEYKNNHFKSVKCLETGVIYNTIKEASIKTNINRSSIRMCCKGKYRHAGGFHWEYFIDK